MNKEKSDKMRNENVQAQIKINALNARCERLEQLALHREQDLKIVLLAFREHLLGEGVAENEVQEKMSAMVKATTEKLIAEVKGDETENNGD